MSNVSSMSIDEAKSANAQSPGVPPSGNDAEFCDSPTAFARFGLKRATLYHLLELGKIRSASLRSGDQSKGKRLWHVESVRQYLYGQMEGSN